MPVLENPAQYTAECVEEREHAIFVVFQDYQELGKVLIPKVLIDDDSECFKAGTSGALCIPEWLFQDRLQKWKDSRPIQKPKPPATLSTEEELFLSKVREEPGLHARPSKALVALETRGLVRRVRGDEAAHTAWWPTD